MERKRISFLSREEQALRALANDENGADYAALITLAGLVLAGEKIDPDFQKVANAIVAQALLFDHLPQKKKGRPKDTDRTKGLSVAGHYFTLMDAGFSYADAVVQVSAIFHKDERHIMRLVKENKKLIGNSREEREKNREWWRLCARMDEKMIASGQESADQRLLKQYQEVLERNDERDLIAELDEMIEEVVNRRVPTDTK